MAIDVEFDWGGRTYAVTLPGASWNIYTLKVAALDKIMLTTDLRTGEDIFVDWSQVAVIRLLSERDPGPAPAQQQPAAGYGTPGYGTPGYGAQGGGPAPGYYPDPLPGAQKYHRRWWDGAGWTTRTDPELDPGAPAPTADALAEQPPPRPR